MMTREELCEICRDLEKLGHAFTVTLLLKHDREQRECLARVEAERDELARCIELHDTIDAGIAQAQLAEMRRIVAGFLFNYDDGFGKPWERRLLDYARKLVTAKEFNAQAEQQEAQGAQVGDDIAHMQAVMKGADDDLDCARRLHAAGYRRAALATQPAVRGAEHDQ